MDILGPFHPISITANVVANLASDILMHRLKSLRQTKFGHLLTRAGLIDPDFENRLRESLENSFEIFFDDHPEYALTGIVSFFRDPHVADQIGSFILDRKPIDRAKIESAFQRHISDEPVTRLLVRPRNLDEYTIISDFLSCYRKALISELSVPQFALLLQIIDQTSLIKDEIQLSENRVRREIVSLNETIETARLDSLQDLLEACKSQVENEIKGAIGEKYIPTLYIDRSAQQPIEEFLSKRPSQAVTYVTRALSAIDEIKDSIRVQQAQIRELINLRDNDVLSGREAARLAELDDLLSSVESIIPVLKDFHVVLQTDKSSVSAIREWLQKIEDHPGCLREISKNIEAIKHHLKNCLLIKDVAGRGKTNLACALATNHAQSQPTILIAAGTLNIEDKFSIEKYIAATLGYSGTSFTLLSRLQNMVSSPGVRRAVVPRSVRVFSAV